MAKNRMGEGLPKIVSKYTMWGVKNWYLEELRIGGEKVFFKQLRSCAQQHPRGDPFHEKQQEMAQEIFLIAVRSGVVACDEKWATLVLSWMDDDAVYRMLGPKKQAATRAEARKALKDALAGTHGGLVLAGLTMGDMPQLKAVELFDRLIAVL
jgi:hypothetical protein